MIKIEKGIPVMPPRKSMDGDFSQMGVGDSFGLPLGDEAQIKSAKAVSMRFRTFAKKMGWAVSCHAVDGQLLRCWRVS